MQAELARRAAVMLLLLAAHAEGLGACWMAGPMVARDEIDGCSGSPALAHGGRDRHRSPRARVARASPGRKPIERVTEFIE